MSKRRKLDPNRVAAQQLQLDGFLVLKIPTIQVTPELWDSEIQAMSEFKPDAKLFSSNGLLATPSSFHNLLVRRLREEIFESVRLILTELADELGFDRAELLIGPMLQRMPGQRTEEQWNYSRSKSRNLEQGDVVLNGWLNADEHAHIFSFCPGSHTTGFALVNTNLRQFWRARSERVAVPPKHVVLFFDSLVHGSLSSVARQRRLYLGWRLTNSTLPFVTDIKHRLTTQSIIPTYDGKLPEIWPEHYWSQGRKLSELSASFVPAMQNSTSQSRIEIRHVFRYSPCLAKLGLPKYQEYSEQEQELYKPFLL